MRFHGNEKLMVEILKIEKSEDRVEDNKNVEEEYKEMENRR